MNFQLGLPRGFVVSPDGNRIVFLRSDSGTSRTHSLWVYDVATGTERNVADPTLLLASDDEELTAEERERRERMLSQCRALLLSGGVPTLGQNADGTSVLGWPSTALRSVSSALVALVRTQPPWELMPAVKQASGLPGLVVPLVSPPLRQSAPSPRSPRRGVGSAPVSAVASLLVLATLMLSHRIFRLGQVGSGGASLSRSRRRASRREA